MEARNETSQMAGHNSLLADVADLEFVLSYSNDIARLV